MSRSFHQRHRDSHHNKSPREILAIEKRNGVNRIIWRNRKIKPYGRKDFIGYGEETHLRKYGEYFAPVIDKKRERRRAKQQILIELSFD